MDNNLIGRTIRNRYHIIKQLGRGGTGVIFIAEDRQCFNELCVVKQLKPQSHDTQKLQIYRRLFNTEAEVLSHLGEYNRIPRLLAYFSENKNFFIVQELIEGKSISEEIAHNIPFSQVAIIDLLEGVLEILVFLQEQGIIHRDLKPANLIRRDTDNKIVLIDFGSVKQIATRNHTNIYYKSNIIIGTENYIPIEQVMGHPGFYSDLYSLGIIAVQALTGKLPKELAIDRKSELIWRNYLSKKKRYNPLLLKAIDKAIRYQHQERYQSASEFLKDVRAIKESRAITVNFRQLGSYIKLNFAKLATVVAGLLGILIIFALNLFFNWQQTRKLEYTYYEDRDYGIEIAYPTTWQTKTRDDFLISGIILLSPLEDSQDIFQERVSVFVENLVSNTSLSQYTAESIAEIKQLSDPNISKVKKSVLGNYEARSVVYEGEDRGLSVKKMQIWTVFDNKAYTITYTAQPDRFENYLPIVKQIITSFDLLF